MDGVYLLNSPFTFQAMEKHAAYCAMMRLGLKVPTTALVPYKNPVDHAKYAYTAERYNRSFDLDAVAEHVGYPLFMKPYDGGAWVGVSRIRNADELHRAYDESGEMLMHLQASVEGYDVFARSLSIGAETMVMKFDPDQPMHAPLLGVARLPRPRHRRRGRSRSAASSTRSSAGSSTPARRWSRGTEVHPIDYANACPDVAITSLHYYFPWAMKALRASGRCSAPRPGGRRSRTSTRRRGSRSPTATTCPTRRSWRPTARWPTTTSTPSATRTSAPRGSPSSTRWRSSYFEGVGLRPGAVETVTAMFPRARARPVRRALPRPAAARGAATSGDPAAAEPRMTCAGRGAGSAGRPGVHRLVGVHVLDVAPHHLAQRVGPVAVVEEPVERRRLPGRAVAPRVRQRPSMMPSSRSLSAVVDSPLLAALGGPAAAGGAAPARSPAPRRCPASRSGRRCRASPRCGSSPPRPRTTSATTPAGRPRRAP